MTSPTLIVLAKQPVPGRVKTRLVPPLTHSFAARLAAAALTDTLDVVEQADASERVLAFDGDECGWLRPGWRYVAQSGGGLDARLAAAFSTVRGPAVLVGMDTPQLTVEQLAGFDPQRFDACLGPAEDGGFWAIGFADAGRAELALRDIPMSTGYTGVVQLARLQDLGLSVQLLDPLLDVDTVADAHRVAASAPRTSFAAALRAASAA